MRLTKRWVFFFAFLLLLLLAVQRAFRNDAKSPINKTKVPAPVTSSVLPVGSPNQPQGGEASHTKIAIDGKQQLVNFFNTSINFYGKVVDEQGVPIAAVTTYYIVGSDSLSGGPTYEGPVTGQDGLFSIIGKNGPDLSVWVRHPAYYQTTSADQIFEYSSRQYTPGKEPPSLPTQDKPAVFVLKKRGAAEPLIRFKNIRLSLPLNGAPVAFNMRSGRGGAGSEVVMFALKSEADKLPLNAFHPFDWSIAIQVPNGGLIERLDALNFDAPANQYLPEILSENDPKKMKGKWSSVIKKDFFLSFGSGTYGRLRIEVSGEKGRVIVESFLNPKFGGRNLEFDPTKDPSAP